MTRDVKTQRGLTTERVVEAALRAADEGGIEAVSLRRLAGALEVTPMAIYRHVRNKSHLLDLMVERLLDQVDLASDEAASWQERLRTLLASFQAVVEAHPATALLLSRPFVSPAALRVSDAMLAILESAGFDEARSARLLQVITGMVLGPAVNRATWAAASRDLPSHADYQAFLNGLPAGVLPYFLSPTDGSMDRSTSDADRLTVELLVGGLDALSAEPARRRESGNVGVE